MKCPKCESTEIDQCSACKQGLMKCKACGFVAEKKYFEGEPLPSQVLNQKALKDGLIESGLNGP